MAKDYVPGTEKGFFDWQLNFYSILILNLVKWKIPEDATKDVNEKKDKYDPAYDAANEGKKKVRTAQQVKAKNDATLDYKKSLRKFVREWIAFNSNITDNERLAFQVTVQDTVRTPSGAPKGVPDMFLEPLNSSSIKVTVRQNPDSDGRSKRGRPADASGFELAVWIGPNPPANGDACLDRRLFTRSPKELQFKSEDVGKVVTFFARWIGKKQQTGKWSQCIQEVVTK